MIYFRFKTFLLLLLIVIYSTSCPSNFKKSEPPLETVPYVDLTKYTGTWYEIARFPHRFQEGCINTSATYTIREDGKIDVLNKCLLDSPEGKLKTARGVARIVDTKTNSKLKVTFFWPFSGDYWIIDLGKDYEYAVVGNPDRKYLWILSRSPSMDEKLYMNIIEKLKQQNYDTSRLIKTLQNNN